MFKSLFWYGLTGVILVGGVYFFAGRFGEGHTDVKGWITWIKGYTTSDDYWRSLNWKTPLLAGTGFAHTVLGGHFVFRMGLEKWFTSLLHTHSLDDEFFLTAHMSMQFGRLLFGLSVVLGYHILSIPQIHSQAEVANEKSLFLILPLALYFESIHSISFWMPEILEFWLANVLYFVIAHP